MTRRNQPIPPEQSPVPHDQRLAMSVRQAAETSGLSRSGLYNFMKAGQLRFLLVGSRRLIRREDLAEFLAGKVA